MIEAVLLFIHEDADNEYVPFDSLNDAQARIEEYVENGYDPEYLGVYIEHSICPKRKDAFWAAIMPLGVPAVYALSPAVVLLATKP